MCRKRKVTSTYLTILESSATSSDMWSARFTKSPGVCSTSGRWRYSVSALQATMQASGLMMLGMPWNGRALHS